MKKDLEKVSVYIFDQPEKERAHELLYQAVGDYLETQGVPMPDRERLEIARTEKGKPYFPQSPELQFSISHSGDYWACAIAKSVVGMDLQEHVLLKNETKEQASVRFLKMARRFFHPREAVYVETDCYERFFAVWTAREAYVKHTGQGIDREFSELCILPSEGEPDQNCWKALGKWFRQTKFGEGHTLCVCTEDLCEWTVINCCSK